MVHIARKQILIEKDSSGNYKCPHFVSPAVAVEIARSIDHQLSDEAAKTLAEISENFALELLKAGGSPAPSPQDLRDTLEKVVLT